MRRSAASGGEPYLACGDAPELLEFVEAASDMTSRAAEERAATAGDLRACVAGDDRRGIAFSEPVGVTFNDAPDRPDDGRGELRREVAELRFGLAGTKIDMMARELMDEGHSRDGIAP